MSSVKTYRWLPIHEQLKKTGLSFEISVIGPIEPDFALPPEIKFLKSDVKPSQCFQIAGQNCSGEVMFQLVDDLEYSDGAIKNMFEAVISADNVMSTSHHFEDSADLTLQQNIAGVSANHLPLLPVCGMFPRKAWLDNRGLDVRFDGIMSELDFYMRLSINGYQTQFINGIVTEMSSHRKSDTNGRLSHRYWEKDRGSFVKLWSSNGKLYPIRKDIMRPYKNEDLLTVNQYYG